MQKDKLKSFTARLFDDMAGAMTASLAYLGTTTGLFRVMADNGAVSEEDLAARSGLQLRYVAEWRRQVILTTTLPRRHLSYPRNMRFC